MITAGMIRALQAWARDERVPGDLRRLCQTVADELGRIHLVLQPVPNYDLVSRFAHAVADYEAEMRNSDAGVEQRRNEAFQKMTLLAGTLRGRLLYLDAACLPSHEGGRCTHPRHDAVTGTHTFPNPHLRPRVRAGLRAARDVIHQWWAAGSPEGPDEPTLLEDALLEALLQEPE